MGTRLIFQNVLSLVVLVLFTAPPLPAASPEAVALRNTGIAELENERPEKAAAAFRKLVALMPNEPLAHGNLAIALLRQQHYAEALQAIDKALAKAAGRADLLAIKAEILQWNGQLDAALASAAQAATAAPNDPEIQFGYFKQAATVKDDAAMAKALARLVKLRPENAVVLLKRGQQAIASGDRTAATGAFLRIEELLWQAPPIAQKAMGMLEKALETDDLAAARVPALRLENVLKVSPMYRESLRELQTGIQGIPVQRFLDEPMPTRFGEPLAIRFAGTTLDDSPTAGRALAVGDLDGDDTPDIARVRQQKDGDVLEIRLASKRFAVATTHPAADVGALLITDLDNDGHLDILGFSPQGGTVWRGNGDGSVTTAPDALGLAQAGAMAATVIDFDIEGDLDLALLAEKGADLYRNSLQGPLEAVGDKALPRLSLGPPGSVVASDLDRDGDLDLLLAHGRGLTWLDNLRQGRFTDRSAAAGLPSAALAAAVSADLDDDGLPELVAAGAGLRVWQNRGGRFTPATFSGLPGKETSLTALIAFDGDNDGRYDLATAGPRGVQVLTRGQAAAFRAADVGGGPATATALATADLDRDGDLDLIAAGPAGLHRLTNEGGNRNHWLALRLRGLDKGNSKNNLFGVGSVVEVRNGPAYQFREAAGDVVHIGLGKARAADVLRVVWTNGVPQNRLQLKGDQRIVEEQLLKGSCPFLYAWNGEAMTFVTDLLWGAPLGLPAAPGVWVGSDPSELVRVDGLVPDAGSYTLRITEELWEAAFFDHVRLWVVDHPSDVEVASNLRIVPGAQLPEQVLASRALRPLAAAWDGRGHEVSSRVAQRDEVYADGYQKSPYQGVAAAPWTFTFDLGTAPEGPLRLHLDGWIFPADASLNLAVAQRQDLPYLPPRLEVETPQGWQVLMPNMGFPAGKTKTMVVDTPPLPAGAHRLRIVTNQWLHWDRIAWTTAPADDAAKIQAQLRPAHATLRYRGFSAPQRRAPNGPHTFDYAAVEADSPWLPFPGRYTRYGDVRPLLAAADDLSVILAPGDELALRFDADGLPPLRAGWQRTLFLESHGWDKDADRNTYEALQLEPLPFRAMSGYPYGPGESYPDSTQHREYRERWLTRELTLDLD